MRPRVHSSSTVHNGQDVEQPVCIDRWQRSCGICVYIYTHVYMNIQFSSVQFSHSVVSDSLRPHESQHARPPCPSPTPGVHSDSRPSSQRCHPAISSSVVPFSSCPQSLPASESFRPWDSAGKNTGVGCHFLLQCMKVKSESEVAQSCPTLRNPMDCSLPGCSVHGIYGVAKSWTQLSN